MSDEPQIPTPMTGYDLAWEWLHDPATRHQDYDGWRAPDGCSWAWEHARMDFDYHMAYLLEIRTWDSTCDYLAVYQKHAPGDYPDHDLMVEWYNHPHPVFGGPGSEEPFGEQDATEWWVDWVYKVRRSEWC